MFRYELPDVCGLAIMQQIMLSDYLSLSLSDRPVRSWFHLIFLSETAERRRLEFLKMPSALSRVVGESVLLPCVLTGYPAPYVRWMFNDQLIEERYVDILIDLKIKIKETLCHKSHITFILHEV